MTTAKDFLSHHGVKGMHWGIRRGRNNVAVATKTTGHVVPKGGIPFKKTHSPEAKKFRELQAKVKVQGVHSLTNDELKHLTSRFDLEQKYSKIAASNKKKSPAKDFIAAVLKDAGKQALVGALVKGADKHGGSVTKALAKSTAKKAG